MMTNFKIPVYPDDFYDFTDGVNIDNATINEWIKQCIDNLEENSEDTYWSIESGNTFVIVFRGSKENGTKYEITVSKKHADVQIFE